MCRLIRLPLALLAFRDDCAGKSAASEGNGRLTNPRGVGWHFGQK